MELNLVISRSRLIDFLNLFLAENKLMFFDDGNPASNKISGERLEPLAYSKNPLMIQIGTKVAYEKAIISDAKIDINSKLDFIYVMQLDSGDKILEAKFIWNPAFSDEAKINGGILKRTVAKRFHKGMMATNEVDNYLNNRLKKYYWLTENSDFHFYQWDGKVRIQPLGRREANNKPHLK